MNITDILYAKKLSGGGGGGGSSDLSTATVRVTAGADVLSGATGWGALIVDDSLAEEWLVNAGESVTLGVVMYKNQPSIMGIDTEGEIATTGGLSYDADEGTVTVTGDGTITIS